MTRFEELQAKAKAAIESYGKQQVVQTIVSTTTPVVGVVVEVEQPLTTEDKLIHQFFDAEQKEYNEEQAAYIRLCLKGQNCILIGAAGTGKTTVQGIAAHILLQAGKLPPLRESTKYLVEGLPGVAIVSFTNKAVNNIRYKMPSDLQKHCVTIHKLLEFAPIWYEIEDPAKPGEYKKSMRFEPTKNKFNPLPSSLKLLVIEESSMVSTELFAMLLDALPHNPQIVLLGDINQLPPVYGTAILGFKMLEWPIVELTKIFRQAAESPIISFAWDIKNGVALPSKSHYEGEGKSKRLVINSFKTKAVENKLSILPWQKKLSDTEALFTAVAKFNKLHDSGEYNPDEDIILIPFNKAFGSIELNNGIAQHLGDKRSATIHEIIAGYRKHYLAVGDKVMYQKEDAYIEDIIPNAEYLGKAYQKASKTLDRWGQQQVAAEQGLAEVGGSSLDDMDKYLAAAAKSIDSEEDRTTVASHTIILRRLEDNLEIELDTAGEVNNLIGGYAITIHKAQGSEWRKVFCVFHHTHAVMLCREILYTAVTRAKESLYVICEPNTFEKGVLSQRIKGTTLAEKAEYFKGKQEEMEGALAKVDDTLTISPLKLKLSDLVPKETAELAQKNLDYHWALAETLFGKKIGIKPVLDFNLYRKNAIGLAHYIKGMIKLNPVYIAAGDVDLLNYMLTDTVIHEICHFAAYRVYKEHGHGYYWKLCMSCMGVKTERICPLPVPEYLRTKVDLVNQKFEELRGQRDITPPEQGEME
jgi:predicted SprT family Zn-dependent metalloprotease